MSFINWGHETPEQKAFRKRLEEQALIQNAMSKKIFEQRAAANAASPAGATGGGGNAPSNNKKLVEAISWDFWASGGYGAVEGQSSTSFDTWTTETFPAVNNVTRLKLFTGAGANAHVHENLKSSHLKIELYDNLKDSWVRVWSKILINRNYPTDSSEDYFFNVDVDFPAISEVTAIRVSSEPGSDQSFHDWDGATFELYQFGEKSTDLQLVWTDITQTPVEDPTSLGDWNDYFDGSYFTNVSVVGNIVNLTPGGPVLFRDNLFSPEKSGNQNLVEVIDNANCVIELGDQTLANCYRLTKAIFPACTYVGSEALTNQNLAEVDLSSVEEIAAWGLANIYSIASLNLLELVTVNEYSLSYSSTKSISAPKLQSIPNNCFYGCDKLETVYMPLCTTLGESTADDHVFRNIASKPFTLTVGSVLATCNGGNPDGDIIALIAIMSPETVTINYV